MPKHNIEDLNRLHHEGLNCDSEIFAEQRSNLLLIAGEHYSKKNNRFWNRVRDNRDVTNDQKLRLTKNHVQKIVKTYVNNIISNSPGVTIVPDLDNELQDQKTAELNLAVWRDAKQKHRLKEKVREWCESFIYTGEVALKIFWDAQKGRLVGFNQKMGKDGEPLFDEMGEAVADKESPVFSGDFVFEKIMGGNLLRDPGAKSMSESPYFIVQKMVPIKELKILFSGDEEKQKMLEPTQDKTFLVFEASNNSYKTTKTDVLVMEYYFRPCVSYPNGYYYITTETGILFEGELPLGIFPIVYGGFDQIETTPRHRAIIKQLRPYQIEINRCASAIATHQVTIGDDKIVMNGNGKVESSAYLPGLRVFKANGGNFTTIQGRNGDQYLGYMNDQISEMYAVANVAEDSEDKNIQQDPYIMLFRSIKDKKRFTIYTDKFEQFLVDACELYLSLAKEYLPDDELIPAIGRREFINLAEFRSAEPLGYRIKVEPQSDDVETKLGKQIVLNHALQYIGANLEKEEIGKILKNMPFANLDEAFDDLTIDYENARNDILMLERGEIPGINKYENHKYMIKKLVQRMKQSDFQFLPPQMQQNFNNVLIAHEQAEAAEAQAIQAGQSGFIPSGGYLVKADFYVTDGDGKTKRAIFPYEALAWLNKKLEQQGVSQANLAIMQDAALADISNMLNNGGENVRIA